MMVVMGLVSEQRVERWILAVSVLGGRVHLNGEIPGKRPRVRTRFFPTHGTHDDDVSLSAFSPRQSSPKTT